MTTSSHTVEGLGRYHTMTRRPADGRLSGARRLAGVALASYNALAPGRVGVALGLGAAAAAALMALFLAFQRWG